MALSTTEDPIFRHCCEALYNSEAGQAGFSTDERLVTHYFGVCTWPEALDDQLCCWKALLVCPARRLLKSASRGY